ncbi:MAG: hypothetical protein Kow0019_07090 [Methanobacteriaceae archaeon]
MFFTVEGHEVRAEVEKEEIFKSKHSELNLKKLKIHFQVYNPIKIPKIIQSVEDKKSWKVISSSYYYTEGNPVVRYIFEIEEIEVLNIKQLIINKIKLDPYWYEEVIEEDRGDKLAIKANIIIKEKDLQEIKEWMSQDKYLNVVRSGISNKMKEMKLEKVLWSKDVNNTIKCHLTLIEKFDGDYKYPDSFSAEFKNINKILSESVNTMESLVELLASKKIISNSELENIKKNHKTSLNLINLYEVEDLDEYLNKYEV